MRAVPQGYAQLGRDKPHQARGMAESFGTDVERYDRARPRYPNSLVRRIVEASAGPVLDVGCGTGIAGRQFQTAGATVLGVEPDPRMAAFARARGLEVEVATFESWEPAGRSFGAVVAGQSWHWVDPVAGALKAADVLPPGGRLVLFGHVFDPPAPIADAFAAAYRRVAPDSPLNNQPARRALQLYQAMYRELAGKIRDTGEFDEPEQWQFDWQQPYSREQWLDLLPTTGALTQLAAEDVVDVLERVGSSIDALGGQFTMSYTTIAVAAARAGSV